MRRIGKLLLCAAIAVSLLFIGNTSYWAAGIVAEASLLAHKGLGQSFDLTDIKSEDCTASRMLPPRHAFLENTIASMAEAFRLGANVVELDVHPTTDGQFAVFHDWTLDCRTNGTGVTRHAGMSYLKTLDVGYGYTADGGKTFPFRGKGIGLMPTLDEVLSAFPHQMLLLNIKSNDPAEGRSLADFLARLPTSRLSTLMVYGGDLPVGVVRQAHPAIRTMSRATLRACYLQYLALGWSSFVPQPCRNSVLLMPVNIGPWMWGWPSRFQQRMTDANSIAFAIGPYRGGRFSNGIDSADDLKYLPRGYTGGISTDRIDVVAPLIRGRSASREGVTAQ